MPLTALQVKQASVRDDGKSKKLADGYGMYLEVMPNGAKYWRLKYRFSGKEKRLALGVYPEVSLAEARERRDEARKRLSAGIDPALAKKEGLCCTNQLKAEPPQSPDGLIPCGPFAVCPRL